MKFINLKKFRSDNGLKQKELVGRTGMIQSTVSYLENGLQEVTESQLKLLEEVFPAVNFEEYICERDTYSQTVVVKDAESCHTYPGDWSSPTPIDMIAGSEILVTMGRVSISFQGDIILDRNDGSFRHLGYHYIQADKLDDKYLIDGLTHKEWFDDEIYEDFKRCYLIACCLTGIAPANQIKGS